MALFKFVMEAALYLMKMDFTILGYTLSFFDIFVWTSAAGVAVSMIGGFFGG